MNKMLEEWLLLLKLHGEKCGATDIIAGRSLPLTIMKYRKKIFSCGGGQVDYRNFESLYQRGQTKELLDVLECMFLEKISEMNYDFIYQRLKFDNIGRFYDLHMDNVNERVLSVALKMK